MNKKRRSRDDFFLIDIFLINTYIECLNKNPMKRRKRPEGGPERMKMAEIIIAHAENHISAIPHSIPTSKPNMMEKYISSYPATPQAR